MFTREKDVARRQWELRARLRAAGDVQGVALELSSYVVEHLGVSHCVVLLDERHLHTRVRESVTDSDGTSVLSVGSSVGYPADHTLRRHGGALRFSMKDAPVAHFFASSEPSTVHVGQDSSEASEALAAFDLSRAVAAPLHDADGVLGLVLAGRARDDNADSSVSEGWPAKAISMLDDLLPDVVMAFRHQTLRRRLADDHAIRAENERLVRELRRRNEEMLDDLEQAREFQAQMLPRPPVIEGVSVQMVYRPHDAVSGDLHDVSLDRDGKRLRVFLADTTGHGVRAALATMLLKAEYESLKRIAESPSDLLIRLNQRIAHAYRPGSLTMTAICYDLDIESGALSFASAAHPSAVIVHDNTPRELASGGSFIGVVGEAVLTKGTDHLHPGDAIYVYTDGVSEVSSTNGELFGEERVLAAIVAGHLEGNNGARSLVKAAEMFARPLGFNDDVAVVGVRRS